MSIIGYPYNVQLVFSSVVITELSYMVIYGSCGNDNASDITF